MAGEKFIITQDDLNKFLEGLLKKTTVIAPTKNEFDDTLLLPVHNVNQICFDYENTLNSAKEYLLPDSECIFAFKGKTISSIKVPRPKEDFVLFGLRPCDTKAINLLDKFFERNFKDNCYFDKRKATTTITLACPKIWKGCFCTSIGNGPMIEDSFDVQLIPFNNRFYVEIGSKKGVSLLEGFKKLFKPADKKDEKEISDLKDKIKSEKQEFNLDKVRKNLKKAKAGSPLWRDMASRCQNCGLCLFICPTCSCFTVNDRQTATGSRVRVRQWDACYFNGFTRMAGNQNPIDSLEEMMKRKYMHKLYYQIEEFETSGCTGCGRCSNVCVGNVNWLENIKKISLERS